MLLFFRLPLRSIDTIQKHLILFSSLQHCSYLSSVCCHFLMPFSFISAPVKIFSILKGYCKCNFLSDVFPEPHPAPPTNYCSCYSGWDGYGEDSVLGRGVLGALWWDCWDTAWRWVLIFALKFCICLLACVKINPSTSSWLKNLGSSPHFRPSMGET